MKIPPPNRERGAVAVVIMLALLALLMVLVNANSTNVTHLNRELNRIEERQIEHWQTPAARTNAVVRPETEAGGAAKMEAVGFADQPTPSPSKEGSQRPDAPRNLNPLPERVPLLGGVRGGFPRTAEPQS